MKKSYRLAIDHAIISFNDGRRMRRYAFETFLIHSAWLFILFGLTDGFQLSFVSWLEGFYQYDARWYASIAMQGHGFLAQSYAFPPLHGWLLGAVTEGVFRILRIGVADLKWLHVFYVVAFVLSVSFFAIANSLFVFLSERRWRISRVRLWALALANPVGYFALTAYSDTFFFAITMMSLYLVLSTGPRHHLWGFSTLTPTQIQFRRTALVTLLFAAPWIRLTGFAFAVWVILKRKEVLATFVSLAAFLAYYQIASGDPLFFLTLQSAFQMPEGTVLDGANFIGYFISRAGW